ncbi:MAG: beta-ketoacyl-ACP synthase [Burkholderiaceae bacterium]
MSVASLASSKSGEGHSAVSVLDYTCVTGCGHGRKAIGQALRSGTSALIRNRFTQSPLDTYIGQVEGANSAVLPAALRHYDCRNNRLAWLALQADDFLSSARAAVNRYGPHRVGLAVGTSTSSIGETEAAYRARDDQGHLPADHAQRPDVHTPHSLGLFVQHVIGTQGPCITVSTACSSSAKVFAVAQRWLQLDLVDAVVVGGVDSLCESVLHGFNALQLVSDEPCRPFDPRRKGINLGEAGGFALLGREPADLLLLGCGESSDAHHMSSPHPEGLGVAKAVAQAFEAAGVAGQDIQYLNLHGTASQKNDAVEAALVEQCYGADLHASSTKGWTAHTLGAAGIIEASVCLHALSNGFLPGTLQSDQLDPSCPSQIKLEADERPISVAATHSFGFGGSNCVLVFGSGGSS